MIQKIARHLILQAIHAFARQFPSSANRKHIGKRLGKYSIIRLLGQGGFASVYHARDVHLNREVAIKVLHPEPALARSELKELLKEARIIAGLEHPHIVQLLEFDVKRTLPYLIELPYLVMSYAPGGTLRDRHLWGTKLPLTTIDCYVRQIAEALQYAHDKRVIHRDIKPENMLLGQRGEVLLSDFGIAIKAQTRSAQGLQAVFGTWAYMAPEQGQRQPCPASDQYSLGIVVYEWLTGDLPFTGQPHDLLYQHRYEPPPSLCQRDSSISRDIENVVLRALAKEPGQRYTTVQEFADALHKAMRLPPIGPHPEVATQPAISVGTTTCIYSDHSKWIRAVAWSPDNRYVASAGDDQTIQVWNPLNGGNVSTYHCHPKRVKALAWSPDRDSRRIAFLGEDQRIYLWRIGDSDNVRPQHCRSGLLHWTSALAWSADGRRIALGSDNRVQHRWDITDGGLTSYSGDSRHSVLPLLNWAFAAAWSPDLSYIAFASNNTVQIWDATKKMDNITVYRGHLGCLDWVNAVAWSPDGKYIASASDDKTVQVWEAANGRSRFTSDKHSRGVYALAWSPNGKYIASASYKEVQVWNIATTTNIYSYSEHTDWVRALAWSPNGKYIASASDDMTIRVWVAPRFDQKEN